MVKISSYEWKFISEFIDMFEIFDLDILDWIFYFEYKKKMIGLFIDDNGKFRVFIYGF